MVGNWVMDWLVEMVEVENLSILAMVVQGIWLGRCERVPRIDGERPGGWRRVHRVSGGSMFRS